MSTSSTRAHLERWGPWVPIAVYAALCVFVWPRDLWQSSWDSGIYLQTARSLAESGVYEYQGHPFFLRPPGLPWMLSFLFADGVFDPFVCNLLVMSFAAATVALIYAVVRRRHGALVGLAVALLAGTSPAFVDGFNRVLSEFPSLALMFAGMLCVLVADERRARWSLWAVAGAVLLAASTWVRTAALLALPGLFVARLFRQGAVRHVAGAVLPLVVVIALVAPWFAYSRAEAARSPTPTEQSLLHDYRTALLHEDPGDPASPRVDLAGFATRVRINGAALLDEVALAVGGPGAGRATALVWAALFVAGVLVALVRRASIVDAFGLAYVALTLVYFTYAQRLAMPLMPYVYLYPLVAAGALGEQLARRAPRVRAVPVVLLAAWCAVAAARTLPDSLHPERTPTGHGTLGDRWADTPAIAAWLRENTASDAVVLCRKAPELGLLSDRRAYTYRFPRGRDLIEAYDVDYVVVDGPMPPSVRAQIARHRVRTWTLPSRVPGWQTYVHAVE